MDTGKETLGLLDSSGHSVGNFCVEPVGGTSCSKVQVLESCLGGPASWKLTQALGCGPSEPQQLGPRVLLRPPCTRPHSPWPITDLFSCVPTGALQIESSEESDQGKYECVATNSAGTRYSAPANLYVRGKNLAMSGCHLGVKLHCQACCLEETLVQTLEGLCKPSFSFPLLSAAVPAATIAIAPAGRSTSCRHYLPPFPSGPWEADTLSTPHPWEHLYLL